MKQDTGRVRVAMIIAIVAGRSEIGTRTDTDLAEIATEGMLMMVVSQTAGWEGVAAMTVPIHPSNSRVEV